MNKDLKLNLKLPAISIELVRKLLPYVVSAALVALCLSTALMVRAATNVTAADQPDTAQHSVKPIDKQALSLVNNLLNVPVQPDLTNLGKPNPFSN